MSKSLSLDLRVRVLAAVRAGATHREAAERFGVSAASVSRWRTREREHGDARPKALGGDRRSHRIEAHHAAVLAALGPDRDATIEEVRRDLSARLELRLRHDPTLLRPSPHHTQKRMARLVRKRFLQDDLIGLRQRIRSRGLTPAKMEFRACWSS
jgi:transposase